MKMIRVIYILFCGVALAGCFGESRNCPPVPVGEVRVSLDFRLFAGGEFGASVSAVDVGIFDGEGGYIRTQRVENADNVELMLTPGDYRLVFWGNMHDRSAVSDLRDDDPVVTFPRDSHGNITGDADKLFYGPHGSASRAGGYGHNEIVNGEGVHSDVAARRTTPSTRAESDTPLPYYALTVTGGEAVSDVIMFDCAHRTLQIFVEGFAGGELPTVEISGLPAGYTYFGRQPLGATSTLAQQTKLVEIEGKTYAAVEVDSFWFDAEAMAGIVVTVKAASGNDLTSISLSEAVAQSGGDPGQIVIDMVFSIKNNNVSVMIPSWRDGDLGFDFD